MNKKQITLFIIIIIIIVFIITAGIIICNIIQFDTAWKNGVGKDFSVVINQDDIKDYQYLSSGNFTAWFSDERMKMIQYMKEKNIKILPGVYDMNQATTFTDLNYHT